VYIKHSMNPFASRDEQTEANIEYEECRVRRIHP